MGSWKLGTLFGFPIRVGYSFLFLLALVFLFMGGGAGVLLVLIAFASVLLHELGHALMARRLKVPIREIELHFFGGAAKMEGLPRTPGDEIAIAAAGPAVSFALAAGAFAISAWTGAPLLGLLAKVNLFVGLFNLLPALPMDGGRILRALLSRRMGFLRATELSVRIARGFAVALGLVGLLHGPLTLVALAVLLWLMGFAELHAARFRAWAQASVYGADPCAPGDPWPRVRWDGTRPSAGAPEPPAAPPGRAEPVQVEYLPPGAGRPPAGHYRVRAVRW